MGERHAPPSGAVHASFLPAGQPDMVRAARKDEFFVQTLREQLLSQAQRLLGPRRAQRVAPLRRAKRRRVGRKGGRRRALRPGVQKRRDSLPSAAIAVFPTASPPAAIVVV